MSRRLLRRIGLAEYGGDELFLATLACMALGWALYLCLAPWVALLAFPPWGIVIWFFRDPERKTPADADALISPADGTVTDIEELEVPAFLGCRAIRVGIFLSPLNVHVNRIPCDGLAAHLQYRSGEFLPAYDKRAPERNESYELGLVTPAGLRILVKQISGVLARRIICEVRDGESLQRGKRYGMIKFGSRTELYVPLSAGPKVEVVLGQKVVGAETILIRLTAKEPPGAMSAAPAVPVAEAGQDPRSLGTSALQPIR